MRNISFAIIALALLGSVNTFGFRGYTYAKWWKNNEIIEQLGLTSDQGNQIEKIFVSNKGQIMELKSMLTVKQKSLRSLIRDTHSSREEVLILNDEVDRIKSRLKRLRLDMLLKIREVLSPEQRLKLREIRAKGKKPN
ncbi:Spy/CpxP family protein refolding chaperone [Desulfobacterota bacterium AH_259_B03_O07]|nr:Spy/CpxP family protein refolding chaperone [Desulfobacterota bacterium AH_259_B03_O07]